MVIGSIYLASRCFLGRLSFSLNQKAFCSYLGMGIQPSMKRLKHGGFMTRASIIGKKKIKSALLGIGMLLALAFSAAPVHAQATGNVSFEVDLQPLIILFYFDTIHIDVSTADLAGLVAGGAGDTDLAQGTVTVDAFSDDANISASTAGFTSPGSADVDILNYWAVRAIGNGNDIQVSTSLTGTNLVNGGSTITANSLSVRNSGGAFAATATFTPAGLGTANVGDLRINIDLSGATLAGVHTGGTFTITAESL